MSAAGAKHQFSVADYHEMLDRGILTVRDRVELIRGEVVEKMPFGSLHIACVDRLTLLLILAVGKQAITSVQNPIVLADSEPEPDLVLKRPRADFYAADKVRPVDVLLAIEVSDSSLDFDRDVKGPLYAESGIVEYWIVNLIESCLEVHRRPSPAGTYDELITLRSGDTVEITALPGVSLAVSDILGA